MKKSTKINLTIVIVAILGLLIGGVVASTAFFIYTYSTRRRNSTTELIQTQIKKEYALFDNYALPIKVQEDEPKIIEYSSNNTLDPSKANFYLGQEGIKKLKTQIKKNIGYGPEMFLLDSIVIGNNQINTEEANGEYSTPTNQIFINYHQTQNLLAPFENFTNKNFLDVKVNAIFEIIFHEYYHHLAYVYLNALKNNDVNNTKTIEQKDEDPNNPLKIFKYNDKLKNFQEDSWNKHFLTWFKKLLNYDKNTSNHQIQSSQINLNNEGSIYSGFFLALSKYINQKDLFEIANNQKEKKDPYFTKFLSSLPITKSSKEIFQKSSYFEQLNYLYDADELFVRKYQQLSQIYNPYPQGNKDGFVHLNGRFSFPSEIALNTFMYQDRFNIQYIEYSPKTPPILLTKRFQFDAPFDNDKFSNTIKSYPEDLYNLLDAHMGHVSTFNFSELPINQQKSFATYLDQKNQQIKDGADISFMWRPNNSKIEIYEKQKIITINNQKTNDLIKFGGYINVSPEEKNPIVGISFGQNGVTQDVFVSKYTNKHKTELVTNQTESLKDVEKYFYVTKNWVNTSNILNQKAYFVFKDGTKKPLQTVRTQEFGTPSTYIPYLIFQDKKPWKEQQSKMINEFVAIKNNNNEVVIQKRS